MTAADRVLEFLEKHRGEYVSGEHMAGELSVSRNAVWKAVRRLREAGYDVRSATNRGYSLSPDCGEMSVPGIEKLLTAGGFDIRLYGIVDSTNNELRRLAQLDAREGTVVIAHSQTAGRGRMGRSFYSPDGTGLYMSVLLKPQLDPERSALITTAAAVAVCGAVESLTGASPGIKWVNDVFLNGWKICGILTEGSFGLESGMMEYAIVGIGVNIQPPQGGFPDEISAVAGSAAQPGATLSRNRLAAEILNRLSGLSARIDTGEFIEEYRSRCFVIGRQVTVLSPNGEKPAFAEGVDDRCRLIVRYPDGSRQALSSGEISVKI